MNAGLPRVTVAILSWNRLLYLRATLESARRCLDYPNLEWIVSDNESTEPGLREYLEGQTWLDRLLFKRQTHADAMNEIVGLATGSHLLLWPEDVQFVVAGDWLRDLVELLEGHAWLGSLCLDYQRRATLERLLRPSPTREWRQVLRELLRYGPRYRHSRLLASTRGFRLRSFGRTREGICGSGIPSLTRTDVWRRLGPWKTRGLGAGLVDSSLGAEEDMVRRFFRAHWPLQGAIPLVPVAADIVTDPTGCKAKVRGDRRYGVYMPPPEGTFYYRIRDLRDLTPPPGGLPLSFSEAVEPLGFDIPVDERGDRRKSSLNTSVVYDLRRGEEIRYPLLREGEAAHRPGPASYNSGSRGNEGHVAGSRPGPGGAD